MMAVPELDLPRREIAALLLEWQLHPNGIKRVLLAHPVNQGLHEILEGFRQDPGNKLVLLGGVHESVTKADDQTERNLLNAVPCVGGRDVAPAFALLAQLIVKQHQDLVLKIPLVANVQLEPLPFLRAQTRMHEELERAGR